MASQLARGKAKRAGSILSANPDFIWRAPVNQIQVVNFFNWLFTTNEKQLTTEQKRSRLDCNIDNGIIGGSSHGIKCCPSVPDSPLDFTDRDACKWYGGESGVNVACPDAMAAFGRCSTSQRSGSGGDCNKMSHQVQCCDSMNTVDESTCGWIYARFD